MAGVGLAPLLVDDMREQTVSFTILIGGSRVRTRVSARACSLNRYAFNEVKGVHTVACLMEIEE